MTAVLLNLFGLVLAILFFTSAPCTQAGPVNRTIDDEHGDSIGGGTVLYTPSDEWGQGNTCTSGCAAKPDKGSAFDGTWHDATHDSVRPTDKTVNITFHGQFVLLMHMRVDIF